PRRAPKRRAQPETAPGEDRGRERKRPPAHLLQPATPGRCPWTRLSTRRTCHIRFAQSSAAVEQLRLLHLRPRPDDERHHRRISGLGRAEYECPFRGVRPGDREEG